MDLISGIYANSKRLPALIKGGISTFTLFNDLPYSIGSVLEYNAKKYKDRPAILFEKITYSYSELNQKVNQFANYFKSIGIKRGNVVVLFIENRPETLIITCALAKLGAITSLVNSQQRGSVLLHSIHLKHDHYFIVGEELITAFEEIKPLIQSSRIQVFGLKDNGFDNFPSDYIDLDLAINSYPDYNPIETGDIRVKEAFAYIFTSGTTGMPKASIQTHKRWLSSMNWFGKINGNFNSEDIIYVCIPFFHANALLIAWSSAFSSGSALAIRRKFSVSEFWKDIHKFNATSFVYIGEICRYLLNAPPTELDKNHRITKIIGNGMRPDIWDSFKQRFNIASIYEFYSASESNIVFTNTFNLNYTVGWSPVSFAIIRYDIENEAPIKNSNGKFQRVKVGEIGLMISKITSSFPFSGYVNSKHNEEKIFNNVFNKGDQWFNTGDLMRDIGFKHTQFVDRVGDTFRWKGENVATAEVEAAINALDFVQECAVYGVTIPNCDGRAGMCAIIPNIPLENLAIEDIYVAIYMQLPPYAIPIFIRFCKSFEMTPTQKVKKAILKKEGFENCPTEDIVYVKVPREKSYLLLDKNLLATILSGKISF